MKSGGLQMCWFCLVVELLQGWSITLGPTLSSLVSYQFPQCTGFASLCLFPPHGHSFWNCCRLPENTFGIVLLWLMITDSILRNLPIEDLASSPTSHPDALWVQFSQIRPQIWRLQKVALTIPSSGGDYIAQCTLYTVHCILYNVYCTLHTVHILFCTTHCTMKTAKWKLQIENGNAH